jgi:hypothetical protein
MRDRAALIDNARVFGAFVIIFYAPLQTRFTHAEFSSKN